MTRLNHEIEDGQAEVLDLYSRLRSKNDEDQPQQPKVVMLTPKAAEMITGPEDMNGCKLKGQENKVGMSQQLAGVVLNPKDQELITRGTAKYGQRFQDLWAGGQDEDETANQGDLALCTMISVLTRRNAREIDRLIRLSGRMRDKWDKEHYADGRTYGKASVEKAVSGGQEITETPRQVMAAPYHLTDVGNGQRLVARHGKNLRYCSPWGSWYRWNGKIWMVDKTEQVMQLAKDTARSIFTEVAAATDEHVRTELVKHANQSESQAKLKAMIGCAQSEEGIAVSPDVFDQDPWLLNCLNGTLDLRTGELKPHRRKDLITKLAPVRFDPVASCPRWLEFLNEVMAGNQDIIAFLQRAAGYSLSGSIQEQCLFILLGQGENGKTTLLETLKDLLGGDYVTQAAYETFSQKSHGQIPSDLAAMRGSRLVSLPDLDKGDRLHEALIKQATGGDQIRARYLYGKWFTYTPQFKLWLMGNHKPEIRDSSHGMWRRIRLIRFGVQVAKQDTNLRPKLLQELPGILNWAVKGCLAWQKYGLGAPTEVHEATAEYRAEMDILGPFLNACCIRTPGAVVRAATIYEAYTQWATANGEVPLTKPAFGQGLTERGIGNKHGREGSLRVGLALKSGADDDGCGPAAPGSGA
jgi:putative DNA primase/helicase